VELACVRGSMDKKFRRKPWFENDRFLMKIPSQKFKMKICVSKVGIGRNLLRIIWSGWLL
jgi:hypothetical protein